MFHTILYRPEIPPNTGNIIRLAANTNTELHLIEPIGFSMEERDLKRASLGYEEYARVHIHPSLESCLNKYKLDPYVVSVKGAVAYDQVLYKEGDAFCSGTRPGGCRRRLRGCSRRSGGSRYRKTVRPTRSIWRMLWRWLFMRRYGNGDLVVYNPPLTVTERSVAKSKY